MGGNRVVEWELLAPDTACGVTVPRGWYDEVDVGSIWEQPAPPDGSIYIVESGRPDSDTYRSRELIEAFAASLCVGCEP